ncbi:MAG: acyl-CoA dehydrogenase family protein [Polyangiaceae bacterium]
MDVEGSARVRPIVEKIRRIVEDDLIPLERELGKGFRALLPALHAVRAKAKERGLWAPALPEKYGGLGLPLADFAHVSEELGRSPLGHYSFNCQAPDIGNMELLLGHGSDEQKKTWLEPLARGDIRSCFSMTEPEHAGSNPTWLSTTAKKDGGDYVIDGHKWFTSSADGAAFAIVMAVTDGAAQSHSRASQIIVPLDAKGFRIVRNIPVMGEAGEDYASHAEVRYEGVRVPQSNRIGAEGAGFLLAQDRLGPGRIHHCMRWIGICNRAMDLMCTRAAKRELSPGKPLGTKQTVQEWIAESRAEVLSSRLMVLYTAHKIDAKGTYEAREEISLIKFHVAGVLQRVLDRAIQVYGAAGLTDETPLAAWYRHERAARIYDGPDEVHKSVVAKRILRGYGIEVG